MRLASAQNSPPVFVGAISDLNVTAFDYDSITLDWTTPSSDFPIAYYEVFKDDVFSENTDDDAEGWVNEDLADGVEYSFKLRTVDINGNKSDFSNVVTQSTDLILLFDKYANGVFGYGYKKMRTAYSGYADNKRSSAGGNLDIGFSGNDYDSAAQATFLGANSGYVTALYDHVGSRTLTQGTAANQPRGYNAGTPDTSGGKQAMKFDGTNDLLTSASGTSILDKNSTVFVVFESQSGLAVQGVFTEQGVTTGNRVGIYSDTRATLFRHSNYNPATTASLISYGSQRPTSTRQCLALRRTGSLTEGFLNGVFVGSITNAETFSATTVLELGRQLSGSLYFGGKVQALAGFSVAMGDADLLDASNRLMA
jgi:hypothetical protein